ncbi:MAG TPA: anti-sigma factor antagonist [Microcoleaceae bacterium UBA10368]|jgi:Anti-anti-sigma regulatory factor (antagonist of anti-sigma factor)|nr:anti-sigma factor antagonist [Microcoleaceae cyanobacterium UBA10368]HCV31938.1 anti-sigma factor antagonist [Microcoleaceae cyanobacterium UBA9251]
MSVIVKIVLYDEVLESSQFGHFHKEIERLIESGCKILMLDFSNINSLKNSELMAVVAIVKLVRDSDCILLISSMSEEVRMLFELTGLEQIFQCLSPHEEVALKTEIIDPLGGLQRYSAIEIGTTQTRE